MNTDELEKMKFSLCRLYEHYIKLPYDFLYEEDVRCWLWHSLYSCFQDSHRNLSPSNINKLIPGADSIRINPIKAEYPAGTRFDIAVIDEEGKPDKASWNQPVSGALELKFWQIDGTGHDVVQDIIKLKKYQNAHRVNLSFTGISLLLCHPSVWKSRLATSCLSSIASELRQKPVLPKNGVALHVMDERGWYSLEITDEIYAILNSSGAQKAAPKLQGR